jgi:hypothetical protein
VSINDLVGREEEHFFEDRYEYASRKGNISLSNPRQS